MGGFGNCIYKHVYVLIDMHMNRGRAEKKLVYTYIDVLKYIYMYIYTHM
jgi:hypothetical protein